ncbi:unnamed protein product [Brachionus calyciflorus]|uniref:MULE transposase domain-containing protein n=1 Tax=Brachionus calyciflorus TaxID=104777 RepID=A0A814G7E5_9BILA|nr:unnamed protein product [Brachionus calyciflorus]
MAECEKGFNFCYSYNCLLQELQSKYESRSIAEFWPSETTARNTCYHIFYSRKEVECRSFANLEINEQQKYITLNNGRQLFLKYDNMNKSGNRILIFMSDISSEILEKSEEIHMDGTFKYAPGLFYQILGVHGVYKNFVLPFAFIFLEKKEAGSYYESLEQIKRLS